MHVRQALQQESEVQGSGWVIVNDENANANWSPGAVLACLNRFSTRFTPHATTDCSGCFSRSRRLQRWSYVLDAMRATRAHPTEIILGRKTHVIWSKSGCVNLSFVVTTDRVGEVPVL